MTIGLGRQLLWVETDSPDSDAITLLHDCRCALDDLIKMKITWREYLDRLEMNGVGMDDYLNDLELDLDLCT